MPLAAWSAEPKNIGLSISYTPKYRVAHSGGYLLLYWQYLGGEVESVWGGS
jgi:hypothetical protein